MIDADRSLSEAAEPCARLTSAFLPVRDNGKIVGVVTDRDITITGHGGGHGSQHHAGWVRDDFGLRVLRGRRPGSTVAHIMKEKQLKRVMVLNQQKTLAGVISLGDIANRVGDEDLSAGRSEHVSEPGTSTCTGRHRLAQGNGYTGRRWISPPFARRLTLPAAWS